jgi:hypothetical protein
MQKGIYSFKHLSEVMKHHRPYREFYLLANQHQSSIMHMFSEFRSYLGASVFREISHLLFLMVCVVVGTPDFVVESAGFNRFTSTLPRVFKKKIISQRYSAKHAAKGSRTKKTGQSPYFIGYKKHTLRLWIRWKRRVLLVPAINIVKPANVADVTMMPYFLEQAIQKVPFPIHTIVVDKGNIDASMKEEARKELAIPIITGVHNGMSSPEGHGEFVPECFMGSP